ncbi:MAG: hypothetical protein ACR2N1_24565, partial [Rubripirellula sp.]
ADHLAVELELRELKFSGDLSNETIRIGFTSDRDRPKVAASVVLSRNFNGDVLIQGEAPGGGTVVPVTTISRNNELDQPIILRLEIDTNKGTYRILSKNVGDILSKNAGDSNFQNHGAGKIASSRPARFLRLSVKGNFTDNDEVAKIESIQVNWKSGENRSK